MIAEEILRKQLDAATGTGIRTSTVTGTTGASTVSTCTGATYSETEEARMAAKREYAKSRYANSRISAGLPYSPGHPGRKRKYATDEERLEARRVCFRKWREAHLESDRERVREYMRTYYKRHKDGRLKGEKEDSTCGLKSTPGSPGFSTGRNSSR